jgi:hypothetical protein
MEARKGRLSLALAFALAPLFGGVGVAHARPRPPACEPGTFVLTEAVALLPGSPAAPDTIVVGTDGSVATASGCPGVAGRLKAGRRGSRLAAKWTRKLGFCTGLARKATLAARFDGDCDVLSGRFKTKGAKRTFTARRAGGAIGAGNVAAFAAELRGVLGDVVADVAAALPPASGDPLEAIGPLQLPGAAAGHVRVSGVRYARPEPARYELTLVFAGHAASAGGAVLGGTVQLNVVLVEGGAASAPYGLARGDLVLAGRYGGEVAIRGSLLPDGPGGVRATTDAGVFADGPEPPAFLTWVSTVAGGNGAGSDDGGPGEARFAEPTGIAVDAELRAYVADSGNGAVREIAPDGQVATVTSGFGVPYDLGLDADGDLVVSHRLTSPHAGDAPIARVRLGAPVRGAIEPIVGGPDKPCPSNPIFGTCDGRSPLAGMPYGGGLDVGAVTYVAQWELPPAIRAVLPDGYLMTVARGSFTVDDGVYQPEDVAAGRSGEIYFTSDHTVRVRLPDGSYRILSGALHVADDEDGPGAIARLSSPNGIVYDGLGTLYVAESSGWIVRAVDASTGETWTVAGCKGPPTCPAGPRSGLRDGPGEQALFDSPENLALDRFGDLWIADTDNHAIRHVRILADPERTPEIVDVVPRTVQQGDAARVVVTGRNLALAGAAELGPDVSVTMESASQREAVLHVEVAADAEPGARSLRIETPYGSAEAGAGLGFTILPEARGGAAVETLAGIGSIAEAGQDVVPGPLTAFAVPTGLYAESGDRILVADPYLHVIRLVATRTGIVAEIVDLITASTLGMDVNALDAVLGGLGSLGTALESLGIRQAWTDRAQDAIRDAAEAAVDAACAGHDCTWMSMPWAGVPFVPGESGGFRLGAKLRFPTDVTRADASTYYIADTGNTRLRIVGWDPEAQDDAVNEVFMLDEFSEWPFSVASGPGGDLVAYAALPEGTVLGRADALQEIVLSQWAGDRRDPRCEQQMGSPWPPIGIPLGTAGDDDALWVADPYCKTVWRVEESNAVASVRDVRTQNHVEAAPDCADGPVAFATFKAPMDVAVVGDTVWVADAGCHSIRKIEPRGVDPATVHAALTGFLASNAARIGAERAENIQAALDAFDTDFLDANRWFVTTVAGSTDGTAGFADGPAGEARFRYPTGIAAAEHDGGMRIFVADTGNRRLRMISVP